MKEKLHKSSLASKLAKYSAAAGAIIAVSSNADAQVAYSGVQDILVNTPGVLNQIDLDGDGTDDFGFGIQMMSYSGTSYGFKVNYGGIAGPSNNAVVGSSMVYALSNGYTINASNSWRSLSISSSYMPHNIGYTGSSFYGTSSYPFYGGSFHGAGDKYIGVKFDISGGTHFGWIKINFNEDCDELIIKDWAYETTPGDSIIAGNDGLVPTVALTTAATEPVNGDFDIAITFSEVTTGLEEGEIVVTNGSVKAGTLATADGGLTYTVTITPTATGDVTIALPAGVAQDNIGYDNDAATDLIVEADLTSGIDMLQEANKVLVYPNPTKGSVKIDLSNSELDINSITITDLSGRQLHNQEITNKLVNLDLGSYEKGMYILIMQTNSSQITKKIVIQ